jgi:hypothetical protein
MATTTERAKRIQQGDELPGLPTILVEADNDAWVDLDEMLPLGGTPEGYFIPGMLYCFLQDRLLDEVLDEMDAQGPRWADGDLTIKVHIGGKVSYSLSNPAH